MEEFPFSPMRRPMPMSTFFLECFQIWPTGFLTTALCFSSSWKTGVSFSRSRMNTAMTIRMTLARNGTRHSQPCSTSLSARAIRAKVPAPRSVPELDANERQGGEETTTAARGHFGDQRGGAGLLGTGAQALEDAEGHQEDRSQHPGLFKGGQQADGEAGHAHQADGQDQDHLAAEPVADVAEDNAAERPGGEAHTVGGEGGDDGAALAQRGEEERPEDQGRGQAVDVEVVVLQGGAH